MLQVAQEATSESRVPSAPPANADSRPHAHLCGLLVSVPLLSRIPKASGLGPREGKCDGNWDPESRVCWKFQDQCPEAFCSLRMTFWKET